MSKEIGCRQETLCGVGTKPLALTAVYRVIVVAYALCSMVAYRVHYRVHYGGYNGSYRVLITCTLG